MRGLFAVRRTLEGSQAGARGVRFEANQQEANTMTKKKTGMISSISLLDTPRAWAITNRRNKNGSI